MKLQPQLYIDTSGSPFGVATFERIDFFGFESIELNSTVQDVRDISKIFTDYSQSFSVPASSKNNKIFKHYYNTMLDNGFDARIKQRAEIYLNGMIFKVGYIRLSNAILKGGRPHSYKITFFGALSTLSNVLGKDKMSDLTALDAYNHDYNQNTVYNGFTTGLGLVGASMATSTNRDIIYPAISSDAHWYYDSTASTSPVTYNQGVSRNLYNSGAASTYGISYIDLKPAIKVSNIIDAISDKYASLNFSGDFFGTNEFNNLYMLLHNNKGVLSPTSSEVNDSSITYRLGTNDSNSDFVESASSVEDLRPLTTSWVLQNVTGAGSTEYTVRQYALDIAITNTVKSGGGSNPKYDIKVFNGTQLINQFIGLEGAQTVQQILCTQETTTWDDVKIEVSSVSTELTQYELDLTLTKRRYKLYGNTAQYICDISNFTGVPVTNTSLFSTSVAGVQNLVSTIEITRNVPKMSLMDLLKGLFSMFNLTAYVDETGNTVVLPLAEYYRSGTDIDITGLVDNSELSIKRMPLYKNISFKYSEPNTFGLLNKNEQTDSEYGDLEYNTNENGQAFDLAFDGKAYDIKLPFEKMYYERMSDQVDILDRTELGWGWLVSDEESPVLTKPLLFYNNVQLVEDTRHQIGFVGKSANIDQYNRPSNTNAQEYFSTITGDWVTTPATKSINFNAEFDEFTNQLASNGLFRLYYDNYIKSVFDKRTRVFDLKMKAPLRFLLNYKMNDTLLIAGDRYLINKIRTNLTTGLTDLELILKFFIDAADDTTGAALTKPLGLALVFRTRDSIKFNWTENPAEEIVKKYRVYVDGVRVSTDLDEYYRTSYTVTELDANTSYDITIQALDSQGNVSPISDPLTVVTLDTDRERPTAPSNLVLLENSEFLQLGWNASTDNVAIERYYVYVNDALQAATADLSTFVTGLTASQYAEAYVIAKDTSGNSSDPSNTIRFKVASTTPSLSLTNVTFPQAVIDCLAQEPVTGNYFISPYGEMKDWNTSGVTDMSVAFLNKNTFNGDISGWDTSNVTTFANMFHGAVAFNQDISGWNTSSSTLMNSMFQNTGSFNQSLNSWDTSNVTNMSSMFWEATDFNGNISGWDTGNVTSFASMFRDAHSFNQSLNTWNTSSVINMSNTFGGALAFNQSMNGWDVSGVTNMSNMFQNASAFQSNSLSLWNVGSVTDMQYMFEGNGGFSGNITLWNTGNVLNMDSMFQSSVLNSQLFWNVSSVTNMQRMFKDNVVFNQDLSAWAVNSNVTNCSNFDTGATSWALARPSFTSCTI